MFMFCKSNSDNSFEKIFNKTDKMSKELVNFLNSKSKFSKKEWDDSYKFALKLDKNVTKLMLLTEKKLQEQSYNMRIRMLIAGVMLLFVIPTILNQVNNCSETCAEQNENIFYVVISLYFATCVATDKIISSNNQKELNKLSNVQFWCERVASEALKYGGEVENNFNDSAQFSV